MKIKILFASLLAISLTACKKESQDTFILPEESDYKGTVTVMYQGEPFDNEDINVNFTPSEDGLTASITIYQIRFVPQMPVCIDVTIPNIELQSSNDEILLVCERCIPLALGGKFPTYTVTNLTGNVKKNKLSFSLNFGDYPTSFIGYEIN